MTPQQDYGRPMTDNSAHSAWRREGSTAAHRVIRLLLAVWITVVVVVLCATGRWWGLVFVVPPVLDLYLLRRILTAGSGR
jgi:hypothetical protein